MLTYTHHYSVLAGSSISKNEWLILTVMVYKLMWLLSIQLFNVFYLNSYKSSFNSSINTIELQLFLIVDHFQVNEFYGLHRIGNINYAQWIEDEKN